MGVGICEADKQKQLDVAKAAHDLRKKLAATRAKAVERAGGSTARLHQGKALSAARPGSHKPVTEKETAVQLGIVRSGGGLGSKGSKLPQTPRRGKALSSVNVNRINMQQQKELERGATGPRPFTGNNHAP
jgi:hypothetical protein